MAWSLNRLVARVVLLVAVGSLSGATTRDDSKSSGPGTAVSPVVPVLVGQSLSAGRSVACWPCRRSHRFRAVAV